MSASMGVQAKLGMGSASPVTEAYEFIRDTLALEQSILDASGIRGTRSHPKERCRENQRVVRGQIELNPTPAEIANLLPRILGGSGTGGPPPTFSPTETLPAFYVTSDRVTKVLTYNGCVVDKATFRATTGSPLSLILDLVGVDETVGAAGTFPALTLDETAAPYILPDLALVIGGNTYLTDDIEIVIDNALEVRFGNSLIATSINPTDRNITVTTRVPYGDAGTLYGSGASGLASTATFTNGTVSMLFTFAALVFGKNSPVVDSRGEIWAPINAKAYKSGSTSELVVTNDSTP